jgi:hypothetical protein
MAAAAPLDAASLPPAIWTLEALEASDGPSSSEGWALSLDFDAFDALLARGAALLAPPSGGATAAGGAAAVGEGVFLSGRGDVSIWDGSAALARPIAALPHFAFSVGDARDPALPRGLHVALGAGGGAAGASRALPLGVPLTLVLAPRVAFSEAARPRDVSPDAHVVLRLTLAAAEGPVRPVLVPADALGVAASAAPRADVGRGLVIPAAA